MSPETAPTKSRDPLSATAASLRAVMTYVSASDERTDPTSVINRADPDEPVFVLRARDMVATAAIEWWMWCARNRGVPEDKLERAERQRRAADLWIEKRLPHTSTDSSPPVVRSARMEREETGSVLNDCHPDEPVFVIVASDAVSVEVVEYWAFMADRHGAPAAKVKAALEVAKAMARWTRKRVVGTGARVIAKPGAHTDRQAEAMASRPRHRTHMRLVCLHCGHNEKLGAPPYDEEVMAAIRETVEGACPACGATTETDLDGRVRRALTTEMVAPGE